MATENLTLETEWSDRDMEIAQRIVESIQRDFNCGDQGTAFVSSGALPGLQIIANEPRASKCSGAVVKSRELGFLFVQTEEERQETH